MNTHCVVCTTWVEEKRIKRPKRQWNQLVTLVLLVVEFPYSNHFKGKIALLNTKPTYSTPNTQQNTFIESTNVYRTKLFNLKS